MILARQLNVPPAGGDRRGRLRSAAGRALASRATWTLLERLLHDHLAPGDAPGGCLANLPHRFLANPPRPFEGARRGGRRGFLGAEAYVLGAGDGALHRIPRHQPDVSADIGGALDKDAGARAHGVDGLDSDVLGAPEDTDDATLGGGAQVAPDLGGARDGTAKDVGDRRGQRGADRAGPLDGGHERAADGVDNAVQDLTGALDRADQLVLY